MRSFAYSRAASVEEALGAVREGARPLAGGTDLLTLMQADLFSPTRLVDVKRALDARIAAMPEGGIAMGALTPLSALETHREILSRYTALAEAARAAATPQLRNMATIAGNLLQRPRCWYFRNPRVHCWLKGGDTCFAREGENRNHALFGESPCVAVHPSDPAAALLAFDASVRVRGARGERTCRLDALLKEPEEARRTETTLGDDELIVAIELPAPPPGLRSTYLKAMDRKAWAFALAGVAAAARIVDGRREDVRLVLSGVAPVPCRAAAAAAILMGSPGGGAPIERAAEAALEGARPLAQNGFKVDLARALVRRALGRICA